MITQNITPILNVAVVEVIFLFKGGINFKQYMAKKHRCFGVQSYKLYDISRYTAWMCTWGRLGQEHEQI
jgi:hypothetical protein